MSNKYFKNNWCYTLTMVLIISNFIFFTKILQTGDKAVIRTMIDVDQNIASLNLTEKTFGDYVGSHFHFSKDIMCGKFQELNLFYQIPYL